MADRREQERREGKRATSHNWGDDSGTRRNQAFKLPSGVQQYDLRGKEGKTIKLNFMEFIAGKGNPRSDPGFAYFERRYHVHQNIGPGNEWYACPLKNWNKPCPVCEYLAKHRGDSELFKSIGAKQRHLFAVHDPAEKDRGVQVLESAFHNSFGEMLCEETATAPEGDFPMKLTALCRVKKDEFQGRAYNKISKITLVAREDDPRIKAKDVPCLDEMIVELSYDKLKKLFLQTAAGKDDGDQDDDDDRPTGGTGRGRDDDEPEEEENEDQDEDEDMDQDDDWDNDEDQDGDDDEDMDDDDESATAKKKGKKPAADEDEDDDFDSEDDEDENEDDDEPAPPKKGKGKPGKKPVPPDDDEDDGGDEDDDEPLTDDDEPEPPRRKKPAAPPKNGKPGKKKGR